MDKTLLVYVKFDKPLEVSKFIYEYHDQIRVKILDTSVFRGRNRNSYINSQQDTMAAKVPKQAPNK